MSGGLIIAEISSFLFVNTGFSKYEEIDALNFCLWYIKK